MVKITLQYVPIKNDVAFLAIKQDYIHLTHYRIAFFVHVFSAIFVLLAGFTQFSKKIRSKYPLIHKRMGWLYVFVTLFLAGPSGFIIGIYANGGLTSQIAFCLLAILWILFTAISLLKILKKQVHLHRIWMIRSFSLTLSAITLRAWKYILVALFHPKPMDVYQIVAWLGWTLNLLIAEIIIFNNFKYEKKQLLNVLIIAIFVASCSTEKPKEEELLLTNDSTTINNRSLEETNNTEIQIKANDSLFGFYVGDFNADIVDEKKLPMYLNKINISIDSIKNSILFGHSAVAGNLRPFKGSILKNGNNYIAETKEPGNDKYDGAFSFTITPSDKDLSGSWIANDKKLAVTKRSYTLKQKIFQYNPAKQVLDINYRMEIYDPSSADKNEAEFATEDAAKYNASIELLKKEDVENMYKRDLEIMRNAIYARHGYTFQNRQMRYFFDSQVDWYIPVSIDVTKDLTEIEKKNIELIKRYEKHATAYYDSFGR